MTADVLSGLQWGEVRRAPVSDLLSSVRINPAERIDADRRDNGELMHRKALESVESGMAEHIEEHGIENPVKVHNGVLWDGYHRLAAAVAIDPGMEVPFYIGDQSRASSSKRQYDRHGRKLPLGRVQWQDRLREQGSAAGSAHSSGRYVRRPTGPGVIGGNA